MLNLASFNLFRPSNFDEMHLEGARWDVRYLVSKHSELLTI